MEVSVSPSEVDPEVKAEMLISTADAPATPAVFDTYSDPEVRAKTEVVIAPTAGSVKISRADSVRRLARPRAGVHGVGERRGVRRWHQRGKKPHAPLCISQLLMP